MSVMRSCSRHVGETWSEAPLSVASSFDLLICRSGSHFGYPVHMPGEWYGFEPQGQGARLFIKTIGWCVREGC